jgi:Lysyl oxidase/Bacterial Ig domain
MAVAGIGLALVLVLHEARASSPTPQLPDLVVDEPDYVSLSVSETTPTGGPAEAKLLLRFNGYLHNKGPGALDFRGSRTAPPNPSEPAVPKMNAFQRIYEYPTGFKEEPSSAQMEYVSADGHHHWHLQHIAFYSLWNSTQTAEVAPAQKVGFCLEDSEHREPLVGPAEAVYSDTVPPYRHFCEELKPEATSLYEGISAGWRDVYERQLAFQWVDVSDVLPGEYFLRAEADPEHLVKQAPGPKPPVFRQEPTIVPGYDALAQSQSTEENKAIGLTLSAQAWSGKEADEQPSPNPVYQVVSPPQHGTLGAVQGSQVTYTPAAGYAGVDSFTFSTRDPNSAFPAHPAIATVTITVGEPAPTVAIAGAPPSMIAGTSVQLSATVGNDAPAVAWSASSGTITSSGVYTAPPAPPAGGATTVAVQTRRGARDERRIAIVAAPVPKSAPEAPTPRFKGPLSTPTAVLIGRKLYLTVKTSKTGLLRINAFVHRRVIGHCAKRMKGGLSFTCSMTLPKWVSTHAPISVLATLRVGRRLLHASRRAAPVPTAMKAMKASRAISWSSWNGVKLAARFFCGI